MQKLLCLFLLATAFSVNAQEQKEKTKTQIVDTACGQCQFGMDAKGCDLAVRIEGKPYFVTGTTIDTHGDAHAHDGLCNAIRKAEVIGAIKDNNFIVSYFKLLPIKQ